MPLAIIILTNFNQETSFVLFADYSFEFSVDIDKLIWIPFFAVEIFDFIVGLAFLLPTFDLFAMGFPEVFGELARTAEQQVEVVDYPIIGIVFGFDAEDGRLDAQVNVFRYEDDLVIFDLVLERDDRIQNGIVVLIAG